METFTGAPREGVGAALLLVVVAEDTTLAMPPNTVWSEDTTPTDGGGTATKALVGVGTPPMLIGSKAQATRNK